MAKYTYVTEDIPPERKEKWRRQRWRDDRVVDLLQGFTFKTSGRQGFVYYREGDRMLELPWEMSGVPEYDILLNIFGLTRWVLPTIEPIPEGEGRRLEQDLKRWLDSVKYRAQFLNTPY
ncbi:MAG TPA: hypothetical protein VH374_23190 [Polyangia bacterium]|jgi:hypothetical protein|nr:hypothetical protein [Polyangia bacterium]